MVKGLPLHRTAGDAALERAMSASAVPSIDELYAMRELQARHTAMKQHTRSLGALTREEAVGLLETLTSTLFSEYYAGLEEAAHAAGVALLSAPAQPIGERDAMLAIDPARRLTMQQVAEHRWFATVQGEADDGDEVMYPVARRL